MTTARSAGGGEGFCSHLRTPTHRHCALHAAPPDIAVERELRGLNRERGGRGVLDLLVSPRLATAAPWARRACRHSPRKPRPSPLSGLRATALLASRAIDPGRSRTRRAPRARGSCSPNAEAGQVGETSRDGGLIGRVVGAGLVWCWV